jgi:hypothetical protein
MAIGREMGVELVERRAQKQKRLPITLEREHPDVRLCPRIQRVVK